MELLAISPDDSIRDKMEVAEEKLKVIEEKAAIEKTISEIKDLIVRAEFKEGKTKLDLLSKGYVNKSMQGIVSKIGSSGSGRVMELLGKSISNVSEYLSTPSKLVNEPEIQNQIRELRKLLFARESEFESKHTTPPVKQVPSELESSAHPKSKSPSQPSSTSKTIKSIIDDFFADSRPKQEPANPRTVKEPEQQLDDFFKSVRNASDKIKKRATKGLDDFFNS